MRYPTMTAADATTYLQAKRAGNHLEVESMARFTGSGDEFDSSFLEPLRAALTETMASFPEGIKSKSDQNANAFEGKASRVIHEGLALGSEVLADPEFWIWLAVTHFPDVVEWRYRYGKQDSAAQLANYGVGSRTENLLYRLWLRAELVLDEQAADRYHLASSGQIDFYRSHLFRQGYANARNFAKALLRFQYPTKANPAEPKLKLLEIRDLVKRLRRMRSNLFLEILPEEECRAVIEAEAAIVLAN
jgi:hypothetical protein